MRVAHELLGHTHDAYVVGDSAYSSRRLVEALEDRGCEVVIPSQPTHQARDFDRHTYRERRLVENYFQRIKRFRRIACPAATRSSPTSSSAPRCPFP